MRQKLHSRRGASMLIALLFFLTAMMVGAVVLTAASTNAGRVVRSRREQQNYLAVASAAELVKEDITGEPRQTFTGSYRRVDTEIVTYHTTINEEGEEITWTTTEQKTEYKRDANDSSDSQSSSDGTGLDEHSLLLTNQSTSLDEVYYATVRELHCPEPQQIVRDLSFDTYDGGNQGAAFPEVTGRLTVQTAAPGRYTIRVRLSGQRDGESSNAMTMVFTPRVSGPEATVSTKSWVDGDSYYTEVTTTYKTTVTWEAPVITKGAEP